MDLISIVVPIYNVENYLKKCLNSIINQTYSNLEIILVNDGSPDNSKQICEEYAKKDSRIKLINQKNGGLSKARNTGIENANGKYICFIDSDDYISPRYVEILYNMCLNYKCDIAQCSHIRVNVDEIINEENSLKLKNVKVNTKKEMLLGIYNNNYEKNIIAVNKLYNRDLFKNIRYTEGKIHEDESTTYKLFLQSNNIACTDEVLYYYVQTPSSITRGKFNLRKLDYLDALKERMEIFKANEEYELYGLTLKVYCYTAINYYYRYKEQNEREKQTEIRILETFKSHAKIAMSNKNIKLKSRLIIVTIYYIPVIYKWILKKFI